MSDTPVYEFPPVHFVTADEIRQVFNKGPYLDQIAKKALIPVLKRDAHRNKPTDPVCTRSQTVFYFTSRRQLVVIVHQYIRPDGTYGGSGKPDPKRLYLPDRTLAVKQGKKKKD